jgi:DNA transformation protein and related proteins
VFKEGAVFFEAVFAESAFIEAVFTERAAHGSAGSGKAAAMAVSGSTRGTPMDRAVNIGPVLSQRLGSAGIETLEQLKRLGSLQAWQLIADQTPVEERVHTLLALEGAIRAVRWTALSPHERDRLLAAAGLR